MGAGWVSEKVRQEEIIRSATESSLSIWTTWRTMNMKNTDEPF